MSSYQSSESSDNHNNMDNLPDEIDFTNADVERDMRRPKLRANTVYRGKVTAASKGVWGTGTMFIETLWNPLDAENKVRSPATRYRLTVPFANPKVPTAKIPDTLGFCHDFLNALYPDKFPKYPRRQKDGTYLTADGQTVDKATAQGIERTIKTDVRTKVKEYWANPQALVEEIAYIQIEDTEYRGVKKVMTEPPAGVSVQLEKFADTED